MRNGFNLAARLVRWNCRSPPACWEMVYIIVWSARGIVPERGVAGERQVWLSVGNCPPLGRAICVLWRTLGTESALIYHITSDCAKRGGNGPGSAKRKSMSGDGGGAVGALD